MADPALSLLPEPDPAPHLDLVLLRARIATAVAEGRDHVGILDQLITVLGDSVKGSAAMLVLVEDGDVARLAASTSLPPDIYPRMHSTHRRRWFGSWAAAITRRGEIVVPDLAASSLYREHQAIFLKAGLRAARAVTMTGRHGLVSGSLTWYIPETRLFDDFELDLLDEVASLAELTIRSDQARQELLDRIRHDPLTGLENRDGLEDRIRSALATSDARGGSVGLLFVDIDDLTLVNDSLGHTAGDTVIATVASRIRTQLLSGDVVVRFGGDEFIVVLERIDTVEQAQGFAERLRTAIAAPIVIDGTELNTTVCIGITTGQPGNSALQMIDEGHAAVVRAKQGGRSRTTVHDHALDTGAGARLDREVRLREALDNHEFVLRWQPKIALASGAPAGAEALVRWDDPDHGLVAPDDFINAAERAGLMNDLSDLVLTTAITEGARFVAIEPRFAIAVNVSPTQLTRPDFVDTIEAALQTTSFNPQNLIIELTESVLANSFVISRLHELRQLGVRMAIDDFGTGYSSLAYVQQLPVAMVKIDRAFLEGLDAHGDGAPVMTAAVAMASALDLKTTVEGIETVEQLEGLRTLGVDWGQGYLFSTPVTDDQLVELLESNARW